MRQSLKQEPHGIPWNSLGTWSFGGVSRKKHPKPVQVIPIFLLLLCVNRKDASLSINGMCWEKGLILLDLVAFHPEK